MPSHHASVSCMGFLILLDLIDRRVLNASHFAEEAKNLIKIALKVVASLIVFSIALGRVYQSVHLYSQVISGLLISLSLYFCLSRSVFEGWLRRVSSSMLLAVGISSIFVTPALVFFMNKLMTSRT